MEYASTRPGGWDGATAEEIPAPLALHRTTVPAAWVDYNGHLSEWCYLLVMGDSSDAFFRYFGIDEVYRATGGSLYTAETHIRNLGEASLDDPLTLTLQVLGVDEKRVHLAHQVVGAEGAMLATGEQMLLHVDMAAGKVAPLPAVLHARLSQIATAHAALPRPSWVGQVIRTPAAAATTTGQEA